MHLKAIIKLLNGIVAKWRRPATDNTQSYERVSSKPLRSWCSVKNGQENVP